MARHTLPPAHYAWLENKIGRLHLQQRLGIEADHVDRVFGRGRTFFHLENWYSLPVLLRTALRLTGLYRRGQRNLLRLRIGHNEVDLEGLPPAFHGFTILQLADLHLDLHRGLPDALIERLNEVAYDVCVITGDYRARTFGPMEDALSAMRRVRPHLRGPVYSILGNHDFIEMAPFLDEMGIHMLLNESVAIERGGARLYLAGIDDPHYYETDNLEKAASAIPHGAIAILLAHSPEVYRWAAHAGFSLMMCGHTHGGQICLPGGIPLTLNSQSPRALGRGPWRYHQMQGYTSVGSGAAVLDVRFNCPPEITLHHLRPASHAALSTANT